MIARRSNVLHDFDGIGLDGVRWALPHSFDDRFHCESVPQEKVVGIFH